MQVCSIGAQDCASMDSMEERRAPPPVRRGERSGYHWAWREERPVGGTDLPQPGAFAAAVAQFADEEHRQHLGVRELALAGAAPGAGALALPKRARIQSSATQ